MSPGVTVLPVEGLPEVGPGDDLAPLIAGAVELQDGDVVVVAQKVVSKVEGALVEVPNAPEGIDPRRLVARAHAVQVVVDAPEALILRTHHGLVCANAGVDASNVADGMLSLLPDDPDASARRLRDALRDRSGVDVAVIVADTFGRPWRRGQVDVAIGVAGMAPIRDERGAHDRGGRMLDVTEAAVVDELAGAADLVRTKAAGVPVVVIRGFDWQPSAGAAATELVREASTDLFARGRGMLPVALSPEAWPEAWAAGVTDADLAAVTAVAPGAEVVDSDVPTSVRITDQFEAGLAAAVLADRGLRVRWRREDGSVVVTAGRPAGAG